MLVAISRRKVGFDASNSAESDQQTPAGEHEAQLIAACVRGDREAQRRLYDTYQAGIFRLVARMVGQQEGADVTQQVFLQAFRGIGLFGGRSSFSTWMYRLALNECWQHLRRERRGKWHLLARDLIDDSPGHERDADQRDLLEMALARLEPDLRAVFVLREVDARPYREIAPLMQISEGTVASKLSRARRMLREYLIDLGWEP